MSRPMPRQARLPAFAASVPESAPGSGIMLDGMRLLFDDRVALAPSSATIEAPARDAAKGESLSRPARPRRHDA